MGELARGTIADRPWGFTIGALGMRGLSGQLAVISDGKEYLVAFSEGVIVGAYSPLASDSAVRHALTGNLITSTQVADISRRMAADPDREDVELLVEIARLQPEQGQRLRRRLVAQRAARTFSVEQGEFVVEDAITIPVVAGGELDIRTIVYLGAKTHLTEHRLAAELSQMGGWFQIKQEAIADLAQFGFSELEKPALQLLIDGANVTDLEVLLPDLGARAIHSTIYALASCGACTMEPGRAPRTHSVSAPPRVPSQTQGMRGASGIQRPGPRSGAFPAQPNDAGQGSYPVHRPGARSGAHAVQPDPSGSGSIPAQPGSGSHPAHSEPAQRAGSQTSPPDGHTRSASRSTAIPMPLSHPGSSDVAIPRTASHSGLAIPRTGSREDVAVSRTGSPTDGASLPRTGSRDDVSGPGMPRPTSPSQSGGVAVPRTMSPSQSGGVASPRTTSPSQSGGVASPRTTSPSQSGGVAVPRTTSQPVVSRTASPTSAPRPGSPTQSPRVGRPGSTSPSTFQRARDPSVPPPGTENVLRPQRATERPRSASVAPPSYAAQPPPGTARPRRKTAAAQEIENLLAIKVPQLDAGVDYFALLGVPMDATPDVIRNAYFMLARKLHPDRLTAIGIEDQERNAQRLMAEVNTAFAILNDPAKREEYAAVQRRGGQAVVSAEQARADELASRVMQAEEAFKRGEMELRREQLQQAVQQFALAVELQPKESEYKAMLAWAQFAAASDKNAVAGATRKALVRAAEENDMSPTARFFLGRVERMLGREREALAQFYEVLRIKPNHTDATSEIRVLEQRLRGKR